MKPAFYLFLVLLSLRASAAETLALIVNKDNPYKSVAMNDVSDFYYKKLRRWPDGTPVRFIDKVTGAPERQLFASKLMHKSEEDLDLYWIGQKLYSGDSAPIQVSTDTMVIQLVKSFKGGIGYISSATPIADTGVRQIQAAESTSK